MGAGSGLSPGALQPPNPSLPGPLSPASHLVTDSTQGGRRGKKGPGGLGFSTQVSQEFFLHPWDLGHPLAWATQGLGEGLS